MPVSEFPIERRIRDALKKREEQHALRHLQPLTNLIDFCSNDYLGFARSARHTAGATTVSGLHQATGSTGSRLLSGNSQQYENLEQKIAGFHSAECGLLFNSGYDANIGLFSALGSREDIVLYDSLIHASVRDGIRLSHASAYSFRHNDTVHLEERLNNLKSTGQVFVAVESIYSMDGDRAPLEAITALCRRHGACLIVDEAHATGVAGSQGEGLVTALHLQEHVFARVHTFGKALGCHGAVVLGSDTLRTFLINFSRSFIYTTALPPLSLLAIESGYERLQQSEGLTEALAQKTELFGKLMQDYQQVYTLHQTPIQTVIIPGNESVKRAAAVLQQAGLDVRPILSPTVPAGKERLRICIHLFNTDQEIELLARSLRSVLDNINLRGSY
ncbi:MAG TPA: 8-amino-7-oxononanoate synthase [Bacteroidia bacterium]|jgi:8-amino-7-oxononanoate synthase|nr:8-amino-7-oxononanoate synthase [Bacteroidia bacterium]